MDGLKNSMKGTLHYTEDMGWVVRYIEMREFHQEDQLHPDDAEGVIEGMEIEFEIIEHQKLTGVATYAKIIK
jgi:hypothetical protein